MRLLKVSSLEDENSVVELAEFTGRNIPPYAILSHCWTEDEVLYRDIERGNARNRRAFRKVSSAAGQARKDGHEYIWVGFSEDVEI